MSDFIDTNADYLILVAFSVTVVWLVHRWLAKRGVFYGKGLESIANKHHGAD